MSSVARVQTFQIQRQRGCLGEAEEDAERGSTIAITYVDDVVWRFGPVVCFSPSLFEKAFSAKSSPSALGMSFMVALPPTQTFFSSVHMRGSFLG
jgi:hypothetical protein